MISWLENNKHIPWTIIIFIMGFIFYVSSVSFASSSTSERSLGLIPFAYHFSVFFALSFFMFIAVMDRKFNLDKFLVIILFVLVYAISDEIHQYFVVGRTMSFQDIIVDSLGIVGGFFVYSPFLKKNQG